MNLFFRTTLIIFISFPFLSYSQHFNEGQWRGLIHYDSVEVPFSFTIQQISTEYANVVIQNGGEEISIKNAKINNDSLHIPMYVFDSYLAAIFTQDTMEGEWHKNYKKEKGPRFTAVYQQPRYALKAKTHAYIAPKLGLNFTQPNGLTTYNIGLFAQNGNKVTASIITKLGDFRYLEGVVYGDSIRLSSFDGVHAFLMLGVYKNKNWSGVFYYENGYSEKWESTAKNSKELESPFEIISVKAETHRPYYDILTGGGDYNRIDTDNLDGKVVIIQLMGTWCPNSLDQTNYLTNWYKEVAKKDIELIAIAFEPGDTAYTQKRIDDYTTALAINYPMYVGGKMSKGQAALAFPNMGKINAFPTLVIIDKQGYIRYINSYFNGPATGKYYQEFDKQFNKKVNMLLAE